MSAFLYDIHTGSLARPTQLSICVWLEHDGWNAGSLQYNLARLLDMTSDAHHAEQHAWCYSYATCAPVAGFTPTVDAMHVLTTLGLSCRTAKCRHTQA